MIGTTYFTPPHLLSIASPRAAQNNAVEQQVVLGFFRGYCLEGAAIVETQILEVNAIQGHESTKLPFGFL